MANRLKEFIGGFTAAVELHNRAGKLGALVESVCLGATIIDAALRIGLILKHQLTTQSSEILEELLFQASADKAISERIIYRRALEQGVIEQPLFEKLEALYKQRNRVVHRYIISEITTEVVLDIGITYEKAIQEVSAAIGKLENQQIQEKVGMTMSGSTQFELKEFFDLASSKHGSTDLASRLRRK